jgi:hypothetical protein
MIYYGIKSKFFDNQIITSLIWMEADKKPENTKVSLPKYDQYIDWYESRKKAELYYSEVLKVAAE